MQAIFSFWDRHTLLLALHQIHFWGPCSVWRCFKAAGTAKVHTTRCASSNFTVLNSLSTLSILRGQHIDT